MKLHRDHLLPPDPEAYRRAAHPRGRVLVIAPTRAACETIELALHAHVDTLLEREHGDAIRAWARDGLGFGIVAGTGTGKTLGIRMMAEAILGEPLVVGVVNREREATPETPACNVVVVTTGIARRWLTDDLVASHDTIVVDEIHQTSAELELCLALGRRLGCRFIWLSATVDPAFYRSYLRSSEVLETTAFDPARRARVTVLPQQPAQFLDERTMRHYIRDRRGVAVFLPTRAEVERLGSELGAAFPRLRSAFYHGGQPIRVIRPFLEGEVEKPWLLAMTAAGQSALNIPGLDTVVIYDARYGNVVERGRNVLHRLYLGANEILQMAGRVHGRVEHGEVVILSDRDLDFDTLVPQPPEFQLAGDAERVALTCAAIGVDATDLELPVPLDRAAYRRALALLTARGLVEGGRLTGYGREVEALPVERPWAELLVHAGAELFPFVAGASAIESLHRATREERDLRGVAVTGSDHLTCYSLLAEAIDRCGAVGEVHGLRRHLFDDDALGEWADARGVLVKAIEDGALGLASVYRALDVELPERLPRVTRELRARFVELVAQIQPFDLAIDNRTADHQEVRISKTSVARDWGAVAGSIRYFADRQGVARASIEGTTIPHDLVQRHATWGPATVVVSGHHRHQGLALSRTLQYFGFDLETRLDRLDGVIPPEHRDAARERFVEALLRGDLEHPAKARLGRALSRLDEYWRRSGGAIAAIAPAACRVVLLAQLGDADSWTAMLETRLQLDVDALVPRELQSHLDALPDGVRLRGDVAPLEYDLRDGLPIARLVLREGQARRLRPEELPRLDRPLLFSVRRDGQTYTAESLDALRELLREPAPPPRAGRRTGASPRGRPSPRGGAPHRRGGRRR